MTCIVGYIENNITWIGGDSLGSNGFSGNTYKNPKVFHHSDSNKIIMGYTSSFRMGQLLQFSKNMFSESCLMKDKIDYEYIVTKFIPKIQTLFNEGGFEENKSGVKNSGEFLLGYKNYLYKIQSDYSVMENRLNYSSCGSGSSFALGSLHTTRNISLNPVEKIHLALQSASEFCTSVAPPFHIINTYNNEVITKEN